MSQTQADACFTELFSSAPDFAVLKHDIIEGEPTRSFNWLPDIAAHLRMLEDEFRGRSKLVFYHAALIVMLRRDVDRARYRPMFADLWAREADYLIGALDTRWLVSACDTMFDLREDFDPGFALAATLLANTVKLYETERLATGATATRAVAGSIRGTTPLFDGLSAFSIGYGDMVRNLAGRVSIAAQNADPAAKIVGEIFRRLGTYDTVFKRMRDANQRPASAW